MTTYQCYVRGHGGIDGKKLLPPAQNLPIDLITVGQVGSTMSDEVADELISQHYTIERIGAAIDSEEIIYWTRQERDDYYEGRGLQYSKPSLAITQYDSIYQNLALDGDADIGECGLFYWNAPKSELEAIILLNDEETIYMADILAKLQEMLSGDDAIQLYWTACMSAEYWSGSNKKVSFNPDKK